MYSDAHYLTITGQRLPTAPEAVSDCTEKLAALHAAVFGQSSPKPTAATTGRTDAPVVSSLDDLAIIEKASQSKGGERFLKLWNGDASDYASRSEADFALASKLGFWCGPDIGRIERLMRQSGLARPKWDRHSGYLDRTISNALKGRTDFYSPNRKRSHCGYHADALRCSDSCVQSERGVRTNSDNATNPQPIGDESARYLDWSKSPEMSRIRDRWQGNPWECGEAYGIAGRANKGPALMPAVCRKRSCPICGPFWKLRMYDRFGFHIHGHDGQLYSDVIHDSDWKAISTDMRRRSRRLGVPLRFVAIRDEGDNLTIIASVHIRPDIAKPIEKPKALEILETAIDNAAMGLRPISSCREWKRIEQTPEVERVPGGCSPSAFHRTLEQWGTKARKEGRFFKAETDGLFRASDGSLDTDAELDFWYEGALRDMMGDDEAVAYHDEAARRRANRPTPATAPPQSPPSAVATCCHPPDQVKESPPTFDGFINRQCGVCGEWLPCREAGAVK